MTSLHSFLASYIRSEIDSTTSAGISIASLGGGMSPEDGQEQTNMSYTQTEIVGLGKHFLRLVDEAKATLEKGGLRTDEMKVVVSSKLEKAVDLNARQETKKRELSDLTAELNAANDDLYRTTSGLLDACIGVSGKGSRTAKNFQRIRSRIRMPGDQSGELGQVEPVKPVPEPMK